MLQRWRSGTPAPARVAAPVPDMPATAEARRPAPRASDGEPAELLRAAGLRLTHQRATVMAALAEAGAHPTAEAVAEQVHRLDPRIHLATVYRTLHVLEEHGVVSHVHLGHGPAVYHLAHERHAHAVCGACGAALEVPEDLLGAFTAALARDLGFVLDPGHFALSGWCRHCAPALRPTPGPGRHA